MEKKYSINIIHFVNEDTKENSIDENFYKNNNISYVSIINKKSKSVFNFDIKPNKYKIIKESKNINQNNNRAYKNIGKESDSNSRNENEKDNRWLCLDSNLDEDNPLICLCNCHNFIHFEYLKNYLASKIIVTENSKRTATTYTIENLILIYV